MNFFKIGHPFFPMTRALGVFHYGSIQLFAGWYCCVMTFVLINCLASIFVNFYYFDRSSSKSSLVQWIIILKTFFDYLFVLSHLIRLITKFDELQEVLSAFKSLPYRHLPIDKYKFKIISLVGVGRNLLLVAALIFTATESNAVSLFAEVSNLYINIASFLILIVLCSLVEILSSSFTLLSVRVTPDAASLEWNLDCHDDLRRITDKVNDLFSWQLLLGSFSKTFNLVAYSFLAIVIISQGISDRDQIRHLFVYSEHVLWEVFNLVVLCGYCSLITDTHGLLQSKVLSVIKKDRNILLQSEKINLYLLRQEELEISACGYFNIGYHLLIVVATTGCTYLVVLVQTFA